MTINVLKIGGGAGVVHENVLHNIIHRHHAGEQWIVVHGVSHRANELAAAANIPVRTITSPNGHVSRYTDEHMIDIYAQAVQDVNRDIRSVLHTAHIATTAFDCAGVVRAQRKSAIRAIRNGRQMIIRNDYSGKITTIQQAAIINALNNNAIPVIAPIALGENGENLNVDGDLVAAEIARSVQADTLIILSNVPGLLQNVDDAKSLIPTIRLAELNQYENIALGRMKKKLIAAQTANIREVILADSRLANPIDAALNGAGTHIIQEMEYAR